MSTCKKPWSTHKYSLQKCFGIYFIHVIPNSDQFRCYVAEEKFYAHIDFKKLEGKLVEMRQNEESSSFYMTLNDNCHQNNDHLYLMQLITELCMQGKTKTHPSTGEV